MTKSEHASAYTADLRSRAEEKLRLARGEDHSPISEPEAQSLIHELQVHQIELEMQNDELKQARDDATVLMNLYADLYDFAPVGYFTLDRLGNIRQINLTGASLLGTARSRLIGGRFGLFVSRETLPAFNTFFERALENQTKQICEVFLQVEAVAPICVRLESTVSRDGDEERRIVMIDITERKQAEIILQDERERIKAILDLVGDPIFVKDNDHRFTLANNAFYDMLCMDENSVLGKTLAEVFLEKEMNGYLEADRRVLDTGMHDLREEALTVNNVTSTVITQKSRLIDESGNRFLVGSFHDITKRKQMEKTLLETLERLRKVTRSVIDVIVMAVKSRDPYTSGHQKRVSDMAQAIASEMGLPDQQIEGIRIAGLVHDLGKISIPAEILSTPRKLSDLEYSLIKTHAQNGYEILKSVDFDWPVAQMVYQHHERVDGSGYPQGLKGDDIILEARIIAVADVVEAMASHRPYRPALGIDVALEEIEHQKGVLYDPTVVDACLKIFREKGYQLLEV